MSRERGVDSDNSISNDQNMSSDLNTIENSQPKKSKTTDRSTHSAAGRSDDFYSQPSTSSVSCLLCSFKHIDPRTVEEHMNSVHFGPVVSSAEQNVCEESEMSCSPSSLADTKDRRTDLDGRHERTMNGVAGKIDDSSSQPSTSTVSCLLCSFKHINHSTVEEHMNTVHFDRGKSSTKPSSPDRGDFSCPMCPKTFPDTKTLRVHVNRKHKDILSPMKTPPTSDKSEAVSVCPVCSVFSSESTVELQRHVDEHFSNPDQPDTASDRSTSQQTFKKPKAKEDRDFELLRAQYGMNDKGDFKTQSTSTMQKAVRSGRLTIGEYHEKQKEMRSAEYRGVDDGSSRVRDVIPRIREKIRIGSNVNETYVCYNTDFYGSTFGDRGWGCGYRNIQMLLSALSRNKIYSELLSKHFLSLNVNNGQSMGDSMPSISRLQAMIEWAWEEGFDTKGREQLEGKLCSTKKWIGATEVVTLLSSMRIKCELVDVMKPTVAKLHYRLFRWVVSYFKKADIFKPPLYLQHDGHSRTIIGVELLKDGEVILLILDPGHESYKIENMVTSSNPFSALRLVRRSLSTFTNEQYQIVSVVGVISSDEEYEVRRVLPPLIVKRQDPSASILHNSSGILDPNYVFVSR